MSENSPYVIVGAGAAGTATAKCFSAAGLASQVILFEQHSEPGGSAGYFSRGQPKRTFDAGATQLIECDQGQLQRALYEMCPAPDQQPAGDLFEKIPTVTQHWHQRGHKIALHADGRVEWCSSVKATNDDLAELKRLERFFSVCFLEAQWMWKILAEIPRFPIQQISDVTRALKIFLKVPFKKKILFPLLFVLNCDQVMRIYGIRRGGLASEIIRGLLIDTTQNSPEKSPWLAAAMGISIVRRGIFRCHKGMRSYFRPMLSAFEQQGGIYKPHQNLTRIETSASGFRLTFIDQRNQQSTTVETNRSVLLNLTLWDLTGSLIPLHDPLRKTRVFQSWLRITQAEQGWGAFALYAMVEDQPEWTDAPHYHQMFADSDEPPELQSSLYVSIPARNDPSQPKGYRTLTATIHVQAENISAEQRLRWQESLSKRIERNLSSKLSSIETATPQTFARYTGRAHGQVGGFPLRLGNFLFFSAPSFIAHPAQKDCRLIVMGDTVFPGQGVIACSVSGIVGFERATNLTFAGVTP